MWSPPYHEQALRIGAVLLTAKATHVATASANAASFASLTMRSRASEASPQNVAKASKPLQNPATPLA